MLDGKEVTKEIAALNHYISLFRDLILGVTIALTCVIAYLGGDPAKLAVLDWTKLVSSAFLVVVAPIIMFFLVKFVLRLYQWVMGGLETKITEKFTEAFSDHPNLKSLFETAKHIVKSYTDFMAQAYPFFYAMVGLAAAIAVFYKLLLRYIPNH